IVNLTFRLDHMVCPSLEQTSYGARAVSVTTVFHFVLRLLSAIFGVERRSPRRRSGSHAGAKRHVRFGSKADICTAPAHVRFTPKSGHVRCTRLCPLWARSGLMRCNKKIVIRSPRRRWQGAAPVR